jgi:hypothetical protein
MSKNIFVLLLLALSLNVHAQSRPKIDSLKIVLAHSKFDTNQVNILQQIAEEYSNVMEYDTAFKYTSIGLKLSRKLKYNKGIVTHLINSSGYYVRMQNQTKALELILEAYKIAEEENLQKETLQALTGISFAYTSFNDYREAIKYKFKQWKKYEILIHDPEYRKNNFEKLNSDSLKVSQSIATLSFYHLKINELDSAFIYGKKALAYANTIRKKDASFLAYPINCLGFAYRLSGNSDSAMTLFRKSIQQSQLSTIKKNKITNLYKSYWEIAIIFSEAHQADSSIYYAELALSYCKQLKWDKDALEIQSLLAKNYSGIDNSKAVYYYQQSSVLRDSLYNKEKTEQLQNITFNEQERQKELEEQKRIKEEERKKQIQYSLLALSIFIIIILFMALSRSLITSEKINAYFATLALLMVFEFLNLMIGPYIGLITANVPAISFVTAICMALILSPLQSRFKKWLTSMMQKKKSKIQTNNSTK